MYNIHSHYENIYSYAKKLFTVTEDQVPIYVKLLLNKGHDNMSYVAQPRVVYLHPFGSTGIDNLESINISGFGPLLFCFDQEPIIPNYNKDLFQRVRNYVDDTGNPRPTILLNTEKDSEAKNIMLKEYNFIDCYYFFHAFAAADWYRGYQYCTDLIPIEQRKINKKFITFNRITGGARMYRSILISQLAKCDMLKHGHVSYSDTCPEYGHYSEFLKDENYIYQFNPGYLDDIKQTLDAVEFPLRIDNKNLNHIPNNSQTISAVSECMESFVHVVTETCFFDQKLHLTEKIFKPIVCKQPFLLLGCANNLQYLKSYGFKTFSGWWDENYDSIADPLTRLNAVIDILKKICSRSDSELEQMLREMTSVLEHNYNWFYSKEFLDLVWGELQQNLKDSLLQLGFQTAPKI